MLMSIRARNVLYVSVIATLIVLGVMWFSSAPRALAQDEGSVSLVDTSNNIYNELKAPILMIGACSLVLGAFVFMFARGNPEKTRQARMGLTAAIVGFGIATFAVPILNTAKNLIK